MNKTMAITAIVFVAVVMGTSMVAPAMAPNLVDIDIKPGSDPNSINSRSMGLVPVAILGSDTFDVSEVDVSTLVFGPSDATPAHNGHLDDVNGDGLPDLVTHYVQKLTGLASSDTEACLTGETLDGTPIVACDAVRVK